MFTKFQGVELLPPFSGQACEIVIPPSGEEFVIIKILGAWGLNYKLNMRIYA